MSWSYSGDPRKDPKDAVRFLIGDTDREEPFAEDEEIFWLLDMWGGNIQMAACQALQGIITKLSGSVDIKIGGIEEKNNQRIKNLENALTKLQSMVVYTPSVYCGGIDAVEKENWEENDAIIKPKFTKDSVNKESITRLDNSTLIFGD